MASPKKLLASAAVAAGLLGGGVAGFVLGAPGISGAQTTTVPDPPTTTAPAPEPDGGQPAPDCAPRGDGENCPDKEGGSESSSFNAGFRRGPGGRV